MEVEFQLIDLLNVNVVLRRELLLTLRLIFFLYQILSYCHRDRFLHAWVEETERALVLEGHESCQVFLKITEAKSYAISSTKKNDNHYKSSYLLKSDRSQRCNRPDRRFLV